MDILWRVFHILMEPVLYTFVSVNQGNNEASQFMYTDVYATGSVKILLHVYGS